MPWLVVRYQDVRGFLAEEGDGDGWGRWSKVGLKLVLFSDLGVFLGWERAIMGGIFELNN